MATQNPKKETRLPVKMTVEMKSDLKEIAAKGSDDGGKRSMAWAARLLIAEGIKKRKKRK